MKQTLELPDDLLHRSIHEGARLIALRYVEQGRRAAKLLDRKDPEGLHDVRVALRKLRSCLRAYRAVAKDNLPRKLRRRLRDLADATSIARDAEVQIEWFRARANHWSAKERPGIELLVSGLEATQKDAYERVRERVTSQIGDLLNALEDELSHYQAHVDVKAIGRDRFGATTGAWLHKTVPSLSKELATALRTVQPDKLHDARISFKRVRYVLEPVAPLVESGKALAKQLHRVTDALGTLHDLDVLGATLTQSAERAAATAARRATERALEGQPRSAESATNGSPAGEADPDQALHVAVAAVARAIQAQRRELLALVRKHAGLDVRDAKASLRKPTIGRAIERVADQLQQGDFEIERKFLLKGVPAALQGKTADVIEQGWLPGTKLRERLRSVRRGHRQRFYRTVKLGKGIRRLEIEEPMTPALFHRLWPATADRRVRKRRWTLPPDGDAVWLVDQFLDRDLVLAEVELRDENDKSPPPKWLRRHIVREVTDEPRFSNYRLGRRDVGSKARRA